MHILAIIKSFAQLLELLNNTWTKRFGLNATHQHDPQDALLAYDAMWLAALALDLAETKLQNMTPKLTLGDFQYTGENSTIIKDSIYNSALNVAFTGASVSDCMKPHEQTTSVLTLYLTLHVLHNLLC